MSAISRHTLPGIAIVIAVSAVIALPVRADSISGTISGTNTLIATTVSNVDTQDLTATGTDATYGSFSFSSSASLKTTNPSELKIYQGTFTETFGDGTLVGTSSGSGTTSTFTITYVITGGTGAFAGDTGSYTWTGTSTGMTATPNSVTGSYNGLLTVPINNASPAVVPEPSSLVLLVVAFAGLVVWRQKQQLRLALSAKA